MLQFFSDDNSDLHLMFKNGLHRYVRIVEIERAERLVEAQPGVNGLPGKYYAKSVNARDFMV